MKKISWFRRIFMSWENLKTLILNSSDNNQKNDLIEKDKIITKLETENKIFQKTIKDFEKNIDDLREQNLTIKELKEEIKKLKFENENVNLEKQKKDLSIQQFEKKITEFKEKINNFKILSKIDEKLIPLIKIEKTFFGKSGNKGKANLAEKHLEEILTSVNLPKSFWTKNLVVDKNQVEFAFKSGEKEKWIPIDSKIIEHESDEKNKIIINDKYKNNVMTQAKNVSKYLNKSNTASYGVLVLQNDNIYMDLFEKYPSLFKEVIEKFKIYVCSPSSFVQFAWSLSHIIKLSEKFNMNEKLYNEINSLAKTATHLAVSVKEAYVSLNKAVDKHFPSLEKKQNKIQKLFPKSSGLKKIASLENKEKFKKET